MARTIVLSDLVTALEDAVEARDISYRMAADELGVSPQRLSQWRRGARIEWSAGLQQRMAAFLGVSPRDVLELDGLDVSERPLSAANLRSANRDMRRYPNVTALTRPAACFQPRPAAWTRCA